MYPQVQRLTVISKSGEIGAEDCVITKFYTLELDYIFSKKNNFILISTDCIGLKGIVSGLSR